jgi:outer membrane phospholipase A
MRTAEEKVRIRKALLEYCIQKQTERIETARKAMDDAQETANMEDTSVEEKFESFRTQMQQDRDMFAKQYSEALDGLNTLRKIQIDRFQDTIALGSVVITEAQKVFVSANIGQIKVENDVYFGISIESPLFKAVVGKKAADTYSFRDKTFKIIEVF